jgi:hypothetical protein
MAIVVRNEFSIVDLIDHAEMTIHSGERVAARFKFNIEVLSAVLRYKWYYNSTQRAAQTKMSGGTMQLHRLCVQTYYKLTHTPHIVFLCDDVWDCRNSNITFKGKSSLDKIYQINPVLKAELENKVTEAWEALRMWEYYNRNPNEALNQ